MAAVLVVGYGNPLRGDDGLGWQAAQQLTTLPWQRDVDVVACHQLTPELSEPVSQAALVIFIDAAQDGLPGLMTERWIVPDAVGPAAFSHHLTPARLLACALALYGTCPAAVMLSVAGADFGPSEALSPAVQPVLPRVVARVRALVMSEPTTNEALHREAHAANKSR